MFYNSLYNQISETLILYIYFESFTYIY